MNRDEQIAALIIDEHIPVTEVARRFGLTRQRITQILYKVRPDYSLQEQRSARVLASIAAARQARIERQAQTRTTVAEHKLRHTPIRRHWSDEEMLDILRQVTAQQGPLTVKQWTELSTNEDSLPSTAWYIIRFGTWNEAKARAGLPTTKPNRSYRKEFSDEDLIKSVAEFLRTADAADGAFGAQHYDRWGQDEAAYFGIWRPSLALIRQRMKWSEAKQAAIDYNKERQ